MYLLMQFRVGWGCPASTSSKIDLSRAFQAQGQEFHAEEESDHDQPSRPGGDPDAAWLEVGKAIKGPLMQLKVEVVWVGKCIYILYIYIYGSPPPPGTYLFQFYTLFTVFKASPVKGFEGTGIPYSL